MRNYLGEVFATQRDANYMELVAGRPRPLGRPVRHLAGGVQPVGKDGYPSRIFDKVTGVIDPQVAAYWREHYDLSHIIERDWATLAPKLQGKIHIYVGTADTYYLTDAVYFAQERLEALKPALRGRGRLRRPGRALLERRPEAAQRLFAAALQLSVPAVILAAHRGDRARRRGPDELALLTAITGVKLRVRYVRHDAGETTDGARALPDPDYL